jgi:hypothetical protein
MSQPTYISLCRSFYLESFSFLLLYRMGTRALLLHPLGLSNGEDSSGPRNHEGSRGARNYEDLFRETLASGLESLPGYVEGAWPRGVTAHEKRIKESFEV